MDSLALNPDFAKRYLFVTLVFAGMAGWFGYDGLVRYPSMPARELYASIEKSEPPASKDEARLEAFKRQKIQSQLGFCGILSVAALWVLATLRKARRFRFEWDDSGFVAAGVRHDWNEVVSVDRSRWEKKGIVALRLADGSGIVLDAWHHLRVDDVEKLLPGRQGAERTGNSQETQNKGE